MHITRYNRSISYVTPEEWGLAKGVALGFLVDRIKELQGERARKITRPTPRAMCFGYKELSELIQKRTGIQIEYHFDMGHLVGELSEDQERLGRGMISALVVQEPEDDGLAHDVSPGGGFFVLAKHLGKVVGDKVVFHAMEVSKLLNATW